MSYKAKSGEAFIVNESIQVIQVKLKVMYYSWNLVDKRMNLLFSTSKFFLPLWVIHMFQYGRTEKNEIGRFRSLFKKPKLRKCFANLK